MSQKDEIREAVREVLGQVATLVRGKIKSRSSWGGWDPSADPEDEATVAARNARDEAVEQAMSEIADAIEEVIAK